MAFTLLTRPTNTHNGKVTQPQRSYLNRNTIDTIEDKDKILKTALKIEFLICELTKRVYHKDLLSHSESPQIL